MLQSLHDWFLKNKRSFPWREHRTPYTVWVSEVMLQQTRASVVVPYFLRWMEEFPDIASLARASPDRVIKLWEGLGYYSRARNLHRGAKQIIEQFNAQIPNSREFLSLIHGLGPYTIGAILSFGFFQRAAALDGNIARVMSRFSCFEENISQARSRRYLEIVVENFLDLDQPWVTLEALIELGATVCLPKPFCDACPLQEQCLGLQKGRMHSLPIKNAKPLTVPLFHMVAVIKDQKADDQIGCGERFLVCKGSSGKLMADLYAFPSFDITPKNEQGFSDGSLTKPSAASLQSQIKQTFGLNTKLACSLPSVFHSFTKYRAQLFPFLFEVCHRKKIVPSKFSLSSISKFQTAPDLVPPNWFWVSKEQLIDLPFSAGHRKIAQKMRSMI